MLTVDLVEDFLAKYEDVAIANGPNGFNLAARCFSIGVCVGAQVQKGHKAYMVADAMRKYVEVRPTTEKPAKDLATMITQLNTVYSASLSSGQLMQGDFGGELLLVDAEDRTPDKFGANGSLDINKVPREPIADRPPESSLIGLDFKIDDSIVLPDDEAPVELRINKDNKRGGEPDEEMK